MKNLWSRVYPVLYDHRFEIYFASTILAMFGSLITPPMVFESIMSRVFFYLNLITGILLISKNKKLSLFFSFLLILVTSVISSTLFSQGIINNILDVVNLLIYFLFYVVVTFEIIRQVWIAKEVDERVIFGVINGYISLVLIGFFICMSIELAEPHSFSGIEYQNGYPKRITDELMYFSSVTLLTIGYGDMVPLTFLAKKATVLIGFMGQFYLVIITAIIVGKYNNQH